MEDDEALEAALEGKERYLEMGVTETATESTEKFVAKAELVYLVGRAASKELKFKALSFAKQAEMVQAMAREWTKWVQFNATKPLSPAELNKLRAKHGHLRPVKTRWVLTLKEDGSCKARLVVVGCQEPRGQIRSDSPTG